MVVDRLEASPPYGLPARGIVPVVVEGDASAARVADIERRIRQRIGNSRGRKGGTNGSHDDGRADRSVSANDEPGDENVITTLNKTAGADIQKLMSRGLDGDELRGVEVAGKNGASDSTGSESEGRAVAMIRHDEIPCGLKGQSVRGT